MRSILILTLAGFVAAQTTTSPPAIPTSGSSGSQSDCDAQNILDTCVAQFSPQLDACKASDWECMCQQATNLLSCYDNCPDATDFGGADSKKASYCDAWSRSPEYSARANNTQITNTATSTSTNSDVTPTADSVTSASASSTDNSAAVHVSPATSFGAIAGLLTFVGLFL